MKNICGIPGSGKTRELLEYAVEQGAVVACKNPSAMIEKLRGYNLPMLHCVSYADVVFDEFTSPCVIDDIEAFINTVVRANNVIGFTSINE